MWNTFFVIILAINFGLEWLVSLPEYGKKPKGNHLSTDLNHIKGHKDNDFYLFTFTPDDKPMEYQLVGICEFVLNPVGLKDL